MTQVTGPKQLCLMAGVDCFTGSIALRVVLIAATKYLQRGRKHVQSNYPLGKTPLDRDFGHTVNHAGFFALCNRHSPGFLDRAQALSSIVAHTSHDDAYAERAKLLGHAVEQNVDAGSVAVDSLLVVEHDDVPNG